LVSHLWDTAPRYVPGVSTLTSTSTLDDVNAAYDNNASYAEDASPTKCKAFLTAVRMLIRRTAAEQQQGADRLRLDENLRQYREELTAAETWLRVNAHLDTSNNSNPSTFIRGVGVGDSFRG